MLFSGNCFKFNLIVILIFFLQQFHTSESDESDFVVLNIPLLGALRGSTSKALWTGEIFWQFFGIPYGESPSGYRRFKPPQKKQPWREMFDATKPKRACPNGWAGKPEAGDDIEDCLHLNVFTRNLRGSTPVMVVLHGEMWLESEPISQPPGYFMSKDIVLVIPQYRYGVLGFLSTKTPAIPGNAGIFDAALALEWVQENIRYFGGDPNRVTLVGQSAGAVIAHVLSISPKIQQNLFHQLILQSGTALTPVVYHKQPFDIKKFLEPLKTHVEGNSSSHCEHTNDIDEINQCLLMMPIENLMIISAVAMLANEDEIPDNIGVKLTIGDYNDLLPKKPADIIRSGQYKKYPMIAGVTKTDGMFALDDEIAEMKLPDTNAFHKKRISYDYLSGYINRLGVDDQTGTLTNLLRLKLVSQHYLSEGDFFNMIPDLVDISSIITMKAPILQTVKYNNDGDGLNHTYLYTFNYKGEFTRFGYGDDKTYSPYYGGVCHNDENIYLFPTPEYASKLNEQDTIIAQLMIDLWTSFAQTGIPNSVYLITNWLPFNGRIGPYLEINTDTNLKQNFYDEFYATSYDEHNGITILRPQYEKYLESSPHDDENDKAE